MEKKWEAVGLDDHLKMSKMAGMIGPFKQGASAYLEDNSFINKNSIRTCLHIRRETEEKHFDIKPAHNNLPMTCNRSVFTEKKATHIVERILYGKDIYCVFELSNGTNKSNDFDDQELIKSVENFRDSLMDGELTTDASRIQVTLYVDCDDTRSQKILSYSEAYNSCLTWLNSTSPAIPLTIWMSPLTEISNYAKSIEYQPFSPQVMADCFDIYYRMLQIEMRLRQISSSDSNRPVFYEKFNSTFNQFRLLYQTDLSEQIKIIRSGSGNDGMVAKTLTILMESAFHPDRLNQWLDQFTFQTGIMKQIKSKLPDNVSFLTDNSETNQIFNWSTNQKLVLVLHLSNLSANVNEPLVKDMIHYLEVVRTSGNQKKLCSKPSCIELQPNLRELLKEHYKELIISATQFGKFVEENKTSVLADYQVMIDSKQSTPQTYLYGRDGVSQQEKFNIPSFPSRFHVKENRIGRITLAWTLPDDDKNVNGFIIEYCLVNEMNNWVQVKTKKTTSVQLNNLIPLSSYFFRIATLTIVGKSSFSNQIGPDTVSTVCEPPVDLTFPFVTDDAIKLNWSDPPVVNEQIKITDYEIKFWPSEQDESTASIIITTNAKSFCLKQLKNQTFYSIRVRANCGTAGSSLYSPPVTVKTLTQPERPALIVRQFSEIIKEETGPLTFYQVPLRQCTLNKDKEELRGMQRQIFGFPNLKFQRKTVLVVGATGAGKTTLINAIMNHLLGVEWNDDFRFQLISESQQHNQAHSQTEQVIAYDLFHMRGSGVGYSLTIVDTPGFGDTKGLDQDKVIMDKIHQYFNHPEGIQQLEAVCFVVQASLPRLTSAQRYIFDTILTIFGKDIRDNIRLMMTFADAQHPPVLAAIKEAKIPYPIDKMGNPLFHKFNSSSYFAAKGNDMMDQFNKLFFTMGTESFQKFFFDLQTMKTISLSLTKEVLEERKRLEVTVEGLQQRIHVGMTKLEEFKQMQKTLQDHKGQMEANQEFNFEVKFVVPEQKDISGTGHFVSNCQKCQWTCHYPCKYFRDEDRAACYAMDKDGNCKICPGRCSYRDHFHQKYRWEQVVRDVQRSSEVIRKNYSTAENQSATCEEILAKMSKNLEDFEKQLLSLVETTYPLIKRLDEIALRPHPFSAPDYIDLIIQSERQELRPGYETRIETLQKLRGMADITSKLIKGEKVFQTGTDSTPP